MKPKRIVIWGYPLHSHTHSYIHYGFDRAFRSIGFETHWLTDSSNVDGIDFSGSLFIASSNQETKIPLIKDAFYFLHNVELTKYLEYGCKLLVFQVHTRRIESLPKYEKDTHWRINSFNHLEHLPGHDYKTHYMPWATDLLPHEISPSQARNELDNKECVWIGSRGTEGEFENGSKLYPYLSECERNGIKTKVINPWDTPVSPEENKLLVRNSYLSPSIQGSWQINHHYIPCRIFKNISYGHLGITNNEYVNRIFNNELIYSEDSIELFYKSIEAKNNPGTLDHTKHLMNEVKKKHTYINRVECLFRSAGLEA